MAETVKKGARITGADRAKLAGDTAEGEVVRPIDATMPAPSKTQAEGVKADPDQRDGSA